MRQTSCESFNIHYSSSYSICVVVVTFFPTKNVYGFMHYFFFFQAEDGIRDYKVTGVQTCALPISMFRSSRLRESDADESGAAHEPSSKCRRGNGMTETLPAAHRISTQFSRPMWTNGVCPGARPG